jgi:hypothetical protein
MTTTSLSSVLSGVSTSPQGLEGQDHGKAFLQAMFAKMMRARRKLGLSR